MIIKAALDDDRLKVMMIERPLLAGHPPPRHEPRPAPGGDGSLVSLRPRARDRLPERRPAAATATYQLQDPPTWRRQRSAEPEFRLGQQRPEGRGGGQCPVLRQFCRQTTRGCRRRGHVKHHGETRAVAGGAEEGHRGSSDAGTENI